MVRFVMVYYLVIRSCTCQNACFKRICPPGYIADPVTNDRVSTWWITWRGRHVSAPVWVNDVKLLHFVPTYIHIWRPCCNPPSSSAPKGGVCETPAFICRDMDLFSVFAWNACLGPPNGVASESSHFPCLRRLTHGTMLHGLTQSLAYAHFPRTLRTRNVTVCKKKLPSLKSQSAACMVTRPKHVLLGLTHTKQTIFVSGGVFWSFSSENNTLR